MIPSNAILERLARGAGTRALVGQPRGPKTGEYIAEILRELDKLHDRIKQLEERTQL